LIDLTLLFQITFYEICNKRLSHLQILLIFEHIWRQKTGIYLPTEVVQYVFSGLFNDAVNVWNCHIDW